MSIHEPIITPALADRFLAVDRWQFETERAELADCRRRGLKISAKMYQESVVRAYLRSRRERRKAQ